MPDDRLRLPSQGARFHAIAGEVAKQKLFDGRKLSVQQWKVILISAHMIAVGEDPDLVRGIEGELVSLRESTATMSVSRASSLIEYCVCWATQNGIILTK